jgi:hypothetical protein
MDRWLTYTRERFPLAVYLLLIGGFVLSGLFLAGGRFQWQGFLVSFFGFLLFFFQLRLMDERKDYDKDVVAHPERPLPRGLLSVDEVGQTIVLINLVMLAYGALVMVVANRAASLSYYAVTVYLLLMYKEFFLGRWLDQRPLLYAVTHQAIVFAVCIFAVSVTRPDLAGDGHTLSLGLAILGSFFGYEVCRKLDPAAHPILKTYLGVYGRNVTSLVVAVSCLVAGLGAWGLGLQALLWPAEGLLAASLWILFLKPEKYKIVEGVATLSLLVHLWAVVIQHLAGWPK